jgi:homoserine dehydrogenase
VGDIVLYGQGAGSLPTASAVVGDIIDLARNRMHGSFSRIPATSFQWESRQPLAIKPMAEIESRYYLRCMVKDETSVLSTISGILGKWNQYFIGSSKREEARAAGSFGYLDSSLY